jgi:hypothetical protein
MDIALDLSEPREKLESLLSNIIESSAVTAEQEIVDLKAQLEKAQLQRHATEQKVTRRTTILEKKKDIFNRREAELSLARIRFREARQKMLTQQDRLETLRRNVNGIQNELNENSSYLDGYLTLYEEDALKNRAFLIHSISEHIETSVPIKYTHCRDSKRITISWETRDIQLKNRFGGTLPFNFGRFRIDISYTYGNGVRQIIGLIHPCENNTNYNGYVHPHVKSDGGPCLGNVERMLLTHMSNQDIANVIYTVMEYLRSYNERDPYQRLERWGITNLWDHDKCGTHEHELRISCPECAVTVPEDERAECGMSHSECMLYHRNSHPSQKHGRCVLKEAAPLIEAAEAELTRIQLLGEQTNGEDNNEANG